MIFWFREIAGWLLVLIGLVFFEQTVEIFLQKGKIIEGMIGTFMGFLIFRGGIHLLKVAVAARMCRDGLDTLEAKRATLPSNAIAVNQRPGMKRNASVIPGRISR